MNGYKLAADGVVVLHLAFVAFVVLGGLLVLRWRRVAWVHLPVAFYGALIEVVGFVCPLTPLENRLREAAGQAGYEGGFVEHYLLPVLYPAGLTREVQWVLAAFVVLVNVAVYGVVIRRWRKARRGQG
jgi:hypothetical protein